MTASHDPHPVGVGSPASQLTPSRLFVDGSFAVMVAGWLAFLAALVWSPETLDDVWSAVRDLPFVLEIGTWLIGFPLLLGLAVWQAPWDEWARLVTIGVIAAAYLLMFLPRKRQR